MLWILQDHPNIVSEAVSRPNFDQLTKNLVRFIDTMKSGYMPKLGTAPPMGHEIPKKHDFAYNFESTVQIFLFLYRFIPWNMPILTISHLSFSMNVPVSHIEVNENLYFHYSSFKFCHILSKI